MMTRGSVRYVGVTVVALVLLLAPGPAGGQGARVHVGENVRVGTDVDPLRGRDGPAATSPDSTRVST